MRRVPERNSVDTSDLLAPFRYQGRTLRGVAHYWNLQMGAYAYRFAAANTLVFRSRDLLFRWDEVVATLRRALPAQPAADFSEAARLRDVATKENPRSRSLSEAREFYAEPRNRVGGFSEAELRYMADMLDPELMARWGYSHPREDSGSSGRAPPPAPARPRRWRSNRGRATAAATGLGMHRAL